MRSFHCPRVVLSRCLEYTKCRYNGDAISFSFVKKLEPFVKYILVCPEVEIGLGVPRDPVRLVEDKDGTHLFQPATGRDVTEKMNRFSDRFIGALKDVDGFILKSRSPSCGIKDTKIFSDYTTRTAHVKGAGLFGRAVLEKYGGLAVEDEGRLFNFRLREHFLTKLFLLASFREVKKSKSVGRLIQFHSENKMLLMAYNQTAMRILGKTVAVISKENIQQCLDKYEINLRHAFAYNAKYTSHINTLMHALGYFKKDISAKEKKYFLDALERYRQERIPLSAAVSVIHSWVIRYDKKYLQGQTYFEPYPEALVEITDSGKGRDLSD